MRRRRIISFLMAVVMVCSMSISTAYAAPADMTDEELDAAIATAEQELAEAEAEAAAAAEKRNLGVLGFIDYMLDKDDLDEKQIYDLNAARKELLSVMDEDMRRSSIKYPEFRNGKVIVTEDPLDAASLENMDKQLQLVREVNEIRATDDLFCGSMRRNPSFVNFYVMIIGMAGANRGAAVYNHSILRISVECLAFYDTAPQIWLTEKDDFIKSMEALGIDKLTTETDVYRVKERAATLKKEVGHYAGLFWSTDQVMWIGYTGYREGTASYSASAAKNFSDKYALYTVDEFEGLYREYYETVDPQKYQTIIDNKQKVLNRLYEQRYERCKFHEYGEATIILPTCVEEGYSVKSCIHCGFSSSFNQQNALGHDYSDGICTRCGDLSVKDIYGLVWKFDNMNSQISHQELEVGSEVEVEVSFSTANRKLSDDEFIVELSDPELLEYKPKTSYSGVVKAKKQGLCSVTFKSIENPEMKVISTVDVTDVGGHCYTVEPLLDNSEETTTAVCVKCGLEREIHVPYAPYRMKFTDDKGEVLEDGPAILSVDSIYSASFLAYDRFSTDFWSYDVILESSDENVVRIDSNNRNTEQSTTGTWFTGLSNYQDVIVYTGKPGRAIITYYMKYRPNNKKTFEVVVQPDDMVEISEIMLEDDSIDLDINGEGKRLNALIEPKNASINQLGFISDNTWIADVDEDGYIKPLHTGRTTVRVQSKDGGDARDAECTVTVWGHDSAPIIETDDIRVNYDSIIAPAYSNREYRIRKMNCAWSDWGDDYFWESLDAQSEYDIEVRNLGNLSRYIKEGPPSRWHIDLTNKKVEVVHVHDRIIDRKIEPTCTESGLTEGVHCSICNEVLEEQQVIPACGHSEVLVPMVKPLCMKVGYTEGVICKECGEIISGQEIIPRLGHNWDQGKETKEAGCLYNGEILYTCMSCGEKRLKEIPASGHSFVLDPEVLPSCTEDGLTDGTHCEYCGKVGKEQRIQKNLGHNYGEWSIVNKKKCLYKRECLRCGSQEEKEHQFIDGICTWCGIDDISQIQVDWTVQNRTNTTTNQEYEVGTSVSIRIKGFVNQPTESGLVDVSVNVSDPSILSYTKLTKSTGTIKCLKPGICTVTFQSVMNPEMKRICTVDVSDKGGHEYTISTIGIEDEYASAVCNKCGLERQVRIPISVGDIKSSPQKGRYSSGEYYEYKVGDTCYLSADIWGYTSYNWIKGNNDVVMEISDMEVAQVDSVLDPENDSRIRIGGGNVIEASINIVGQGKTILTVYPKYRPESKTYYTLYVSDEDGINVSELSLKETKMDFDTSDMTPRQLVPIVSPENANCSFLYKSANEEIASVSSDGVVKPLRQGFTSIDVYALDGSVGQATKKATCKINIYKKMDIPELSESDFTISEHTIRFIGTGEYEFRIREKDGIWSEWSTKKYWNGRKRDTEVDIGVRAVGDYLTTKSDEAIISIRTKNHNPVILKGLEATCVEDGYTEGSICSICGEILGQQEVIEALGHRIVTDAAVAATCTKPGLTEGSHCSKCGKVIKKQETVPKLQKQESQKQEPKKPVKTKYSNEWVKNVWYDKKGYATKYTMKWKKDKTGWWIVDNTGWYPKNSWQKIDGVWYYFKPNGYMAANEWYKGYWFNKNGAWTYKYKGSWHKEGKKWWFGDTSGWYAKSTTIWIDGKKYSFDKKGYLI